MYFLVAELLYTCLMLSHLAQNIRINLPICIWSVSFPFLTIPLNILFTVDFSKWPDVTFAAIFQAVHAWFPTQCHLIYFLFSAQHQQKNIPKRIWSISLDSHLLIFIQWQQRLFRNKWNSSDEIIRYLWVFLWYRNNSRVHFKR